MVEKNKKFIDGAMKSLTASMQGRVQALAEALQKGWQVDIQASEGKIVSNHCFAG